MPAPNREPADLAVDLRKRLAGHRLPPPIAKLYSHHTRLREAQPGLTGWREGEAFERLNDAVRLLDAAFVERDSGGQEWRDSVRRAAELLEWLSLPQLLPHVPLRLLSAAAYQIAGYPARSTGLLHRTDNINAESIILANFLRADFPHLLSSLTEYWGGTFASPAQEDPGLDQVDSSVFSEHFHQKIVAETASALGILCASFRWGEEPRLRKALEKLSVVAKALLHGADSHSWLLAKLCAETAITYVESSMRKHLETLSEGIIDSEKVILERYLRKNYLTRRSLVWSSQAHGIKRLMTGDSFALCTPTGSGKTTVAEIAILQSFFKESTTSQDSQIDNFNPSPLVLYLTPSRALAAEVETKLSQTFRNLSLTSSFVVTGLYGGIDWGPTDAWLTSNERTILICTYEKAEALLRFLGPLFIHRLILVVIDEAHNIQFDGTGSDAWYAESRALRLESLGTRLLAHLEQNRSKVLVLSAVASGTENTLACWVTGQPNAHPETTGYRSTRQLLGRLECLPNRGFEIHYDLLDGSNLDSHGGGQDNAPYIPRPFPPHPPADKWTKSDVGADKYLRPYLLWAAIHLAAPDNEGRQHGVLISVTQHIGGYAEDFLTLLDSTWVHERKPEFFFSPEQPTNQRLWEMCLRSCEDYFGRDSREYRLLEKGIVLHHGRMPGIMGRLLIQAMQERIVHLVIATSTLSEGVNLPFETILLPNLKRRQHLLSSREFGNIVGRAGRPGVATEGRILVLLPRNQTMYRSLLRSYTQLTKSLQPSDPGNSQGVARSPLAELLILIEQRWQQISGMQSRERFLEWLERTVPTAEESKATSQDSAVDSLDALDSILLAAIVEIEELAQRNLQSDEWEAHLQRIWQRSYARYAYHEEKRLEELFVHRGQALVENIYPDPSQRRKLYRTSLPPRGASQLLEKYPLIRGYLETSEDYASWSPEKRFEYIRVLVEQLNALPQFRPATRVPSNTTWEIILHWWLDPIRSPKQPKRTQVSDWYNYVSQHFTYRFNWGLGSVIAIAIDETHKGKLEPITLEDWPHVGLPWAVFWIKELITWGTLEPVAAYLLARGGETIRPAAEGEARSYYEEQNQNLSPNELLHAGSIRDWVQHRLGNADSFIPASVPTEIKVKLCEDFSHAPVQEWRVLPVEVDEQLYWCDPAGFLLATSQRPKGWRATYTKTHDFKLEPSKKVIYSNAYI